jgi:hypothetical protein
MDALLRKVERIWFVARVLGKSLRPEEQSEAHREITRLPLTKVKQLDLTNSQDAASGVPRQQ